MASGRKPRKGKASVNTGPVDGGTQSPPPRRAEGESTGDLILRLEGFDSHGTTRARHRGRLIEVEHGIPGETVGVEVVGQRRLRGRIVDMLDPAEDRVVPPCQYFREWQCGGCQWQHISYEGQVHRKREGVNAAMEEHGLSIRVGATHTMADPWRYRSTAGLALGKRAGFRRHGSLAIVPIRDCPISHPQIGRLAAALNDRLEAGTLPDFRGRVRLDVRVAEGQEEQQLHVLIRSTEEGGHPPAGDLDQLVSTLTNLGEVGGISILRPDGSIETITGELFATTLVVDRPVLLSAGSFFQTNLRLISKLISRLREESEPLAGKRVADVYGGVGIFGLFLAEGAREVVEIESDEIAVEAGRRTAKQWGLENVRFMTAPAEEALAGSDRFEVIIVDPPRSGLSEPVINALVAGEPPLILYVSCLAQSLARDLAILTAAGFQVQHLELFDFYPQTYHVELLAVLRP